MSFPLTKREIKSNIEGLAVGAECQFDVDKTLRVRQVIVEFHNYTDKKFETSTKNKQLADKLLVRRIK